MGEPRPAGADAPSALPVVAATFAGQCAAAFGFLAVDLLAPSLADETGLNKRDFGFGGTFVFMGVLLASPYAGWLIGRLGSVRLMSAAMLGMGSGMLCILYGSWAATMLACALFGLCYGAYSPASTAVVASRAPPRRRGLYLAIRQSGVPFAGAIAGRALPPLILAWGWWAGVFAISAVLVGGAALTLLLPALFRVSETERSAVAAAAISAAQRRPAGWGAHAGRLLGAYRLPAEIRVLGFVAVGLAVSHTALTSFSYFYLLEGLALSPIVAGVYLSNTLLAAAIGRPFVGWLVDRSGSPIRVLAGIALVAAATYAILLSLTEQSPAWLLVLVAIAAGLSSGTWTPVFLTAVSNHAPAGRMTELNGRAFSYAALGWTVAAPLIWGLIELSGGYFLPLALMLAFNLAIAATLFGTRERGTTEAA